MADFEACGNVALLKQGQARAILNEVQAVVARWRDYANDCSVDPALRDHIQGTLRLGRFL